MLTLDRCCFANLFCLVLSWKIQSVLVFQKICKVLDNVLTIHSFVSNVLCVVTFTRPASAYIFRLCLQSIFSFLSAKQVCSNSMKMHVDVKLLLANGYQKVRFSCYLVKMTSSFVQREGVNKGQKIAFIILKSTFAQRIRYRVQSEASRLSMKCHIA